MKRLPLIAVAALVALAAFPAPARADLTMFWGASPTTAVRPVKGFGFGITLVVVGFELEYATVSESEPKGAPGMTTGMFNGLVQTPTSKTQLYLTAGGGFYRERYRDFRETSLGTNVGGGIKLGLAGPLRLRLDYRVFNLRGSPIQRTSQRFYAGANISF
jgi:hypothetical protein